MDETPTLLVTREIREHANVFHMLTDMLNSYISVRTMGWEGLPRQVVLLDDHPPGPFDPLWAAVAAGRGREALAGPAGLPAFNNIGLLNSLTVACYFPARNPPPIRAPWPPQPLSLSIIIASVFESLSCLPQALKGIH